MSPRGLLVVVLMLAAGVLPGAAAVAAPGAGRAVLPPGSELRAMLNGIEGADRAFAQDDGSAICAARSTTDPLEGGALDIERYAGGLTCTGDDLRFTFSTSDTWGDAQLFEIYVLIDVDGDISNGCNEGDFLAYGNNRPDDTDQAGNPTEVVLAGVFRTPSCDRAAFTTMGLATVSRAADDSVTMVFGRELVDSATRLRHYGGLANQGETDETADYAPDTGGVRLVTESLPDPVSAPLCLPDPTGDVLERDGDGNESDADQPAADITEACLYYGEGIRLEVTLPNLDLAALGAGAGPVAFIDIDGDGSDDRVLRAIWNGLGFVAEITDGDGAVVCPGRVLIVRDVLGVGGFGSDCFDDASSVRFSVAMGALASGDTVFVDRAGDGTRVPLAKFAEVDPTRSGTDPAEQEVQDPLAAVVADGLVRLAGPARIETSAVVSEAAWPEGAAAVVLARQDVEADALAGAALASAVNGPLLLTATGGLTKAVAIELRRVLPPGGRVYVLGGTAAITDNVEAQVQQLGFGTIRLAGLSRVETGLEIAREVVDVIGLADNILIADAFDFEWALIAGAAAGANNGVVVTTAASGLSEDARAFLDDNAGAVLTAVGPAAVQAAPQARPLNAADAYATSVLVAETFFPDATSVVVASGESFPDGLAGGAFAGSIDQPLLLSTRAQLSAPIRDYLQGLTVEAIHMLGGEAALSGVVEDALRGLIPS